MIPISASLRSGSVGDLSSGAPSGELRPDPAAIASIDLGRYELGQRLGTGGFGAVYEAVDPLLHRKVAIKFVMHLPSDRDATVQTEASALAQIRHPNVVEVFDVGRSGDHLFIVMTLVDGESLTQWLARRPAMPDILDALFAAGRGLAAAHAVGLTHCDFKPGNVLVGRDGSVKVVDFGLARWSDRSADTVGTGESEDMTQTRRGWGTPLYMAPEQHRSEPLDARADVYAFSLTLLEALMGRRPLSGTNHRELLEAKLAAAHLRVRDLPGVPRKVALAIERGLSIDPRDRFPDMGAMLEALAPTRSWTHRAAIGAALGLAGLGLLPQTAAPVAVATEARGSAGTNADVAAMLAEADDAFDAGDLGRAVELGADAYDRAIAQRADELAATAAAATFRRAADLRRDDEETNRWRDRALAALATVPADHAAWHDYDEGLYSLEIAAGRYDAAWGAVLTMLLRGQADPIDGAHSWVAGLEFAAELIGVGGDETRMAALGPVVIAEARATFGNDHRETAAALIAAARWSALLGKPEPALAWLDEADRIYARLYPPDHVRRIQYLIVAATAWAAAGENATAFAAAIEARELQRRFAPDARGLAAQIDSMAGVTARRMGDLDLARELQYASLVGLEAEFGGEHPRLATTLINLGWLELDLGQCEKARGYAQRADRIIAASFASDHPYRGLAQRIFACDVDKASAAR